MFIIKLIIVHIIKLIIIVTFYYSCLEIEFIFPLNNRRYLESVSFSMIAGFYSSPNILIYHQLINRLFLEIQSFPNFQLLPPPLSHSLTSFFWLFICLFIFLSSLFVSHDVVIFMFDCVSELPQSLFPFNVLLRTLSDCCNLYYHFHDSLFVWEINYLICLECNPPNTTGKNSADVRSILESLVTHGAPDKILVDGKPHLGTDKLIVILRNIRAYLVQQGTYDSGWRRNILIWRGKDIM